jgi:hypothetical protein
VRAMAIGCHGNVTASSLARTGVLAATTAPDFIAKFALAEPRIPALASSSGARQAVVWALYSCFEPRNRRPPPAPWRQQTAGPWPSSGRGTRRQNNCRRRLPLGWPQCGAWRGGGRRGGHEGNSRSDFGTGRRGRTPSTSAGPRRWAWAPSARKRCRQARAR